MAVFLHVIQNLKTAKTTMELFGIYSWEGFMGVALFLALIWILVLRPPIPLIREWLDYLEIKTRIILITVAALLCCLVGGR